MVSLTEVINTEIIYDILYLCSVLLLGKVKFFPGAINLHWTTDNMTDITRVSMDFRLIPGPLFDALECGSSHDGGQKDVYRQRSGYYSMCKLNKNPSKEDLQWEREGSLPVPDERVGFPWTVRDWNKVMKKVKK